MCSIVSLKITNNAQSANISDKYLNAYKQYEDSIARLKKMRLKISCILLVTDNLSTIIF